MLSLSRLSAVVEKLARESTLTNTFTTTAHYSIYSANYLKMARSCSPSQAWAREMSYEVFNLARA
jgi:hypothetical protein